MKILVCAATSFELAPTLQFLDKEASKSSFFEYQYRDISVFPLVTGVGMINTTFALSRWDKMKEVDLAVNVGVAGAYNRALELGQLIQVVKDRFGDLGVEEANGAFTDLFELELAKADSFPFQNGWLINETKKNMDGIRELNAITVNQVTGTEETRLKRFQKYKADVETMEGAAFFYCCKMQDVDCLQLRAISNYVEQRNRDAWEIETAINSVNSGLIELLKFSQTIL